MKNNKKIIYLASGRSFSSKYPPRKIKEVVECFRNEGFDVNFIGGKDLIEDNNEYEVNKEAFSSTIKKKVHFPFIKNTASELLDIFHDIKLKKLVERSVNSEMPVLIWERSSRLHFAGLKIARKYNIPYVLEWKDNLLTLYGKSLFKFYARYVEKYKVTNSSYLVVESSMLAREISKKEKVKQEKILTAINAVNLSDFNIPEKGENIKIRNSFNISDKINLIAYVGSFAWYHNVDLLVEAAKIIKEKNIFSNIKFLMVGDGNGRNDIEKSIKKKGLSEMFIFVGKVEQKEVPLILSECNGAVLPDCLEIICPIKVQEYMAMGLPAIVPNYEANREVISNGVNGVLFEPKSSVDLAEKIITLSSDVNMGSLIGLNGRRSIELNFTWKQTWGRALNTVIESTRKKTSM